MFDKHTHTLIAQRLDQAEKQREQIRAISLDYPEITIEDAYAVQREWVRLKIAEGRTLKGHKIGLTSKAMQASSQENTKIMLFNETSDDFEFNADRYLFAENPVVHLDTATSGSK